MYVDIRRLTRHTPIYFLLIRNHWKMDSQPVLVGWHRDEVHLLCCTGSLAVVLSLWLRNRNHMDSYRPNTVTVSHCQRCKRSVTAAAVWLLALSWRIMGSESPSVVVFSWAQGEGAAARTCSSSIYYYHTLFINISKYLIFVAGQRGHIIQTSGYIALQRNSFLRQLSTNIYCWLTHMKCPKHR